MRYYQVGIEIGKIPKGKIPVDRYTLGHIAWGGILAAMGVPFWVSVGLSVGFEILEQPMKVHFPEIFPEPIRDPIENQMMDTAGVLAGWGIVRYGMRIL